MILTPVTTPSNSDKLTVVSVADVKASQRIATTSEDGLIEALICACYDSLDGRNGYLNRALLPQQWTLSLPYFLPSIEIPFPPLRSVDSIKYRTDAGSLETLYEPTASPPVLAPMVHVALGFWKGRIIRVGAGSWPRTQDHPEAVEITFTAGYGSAAGIPSGIKRAIIMLVGHYYRHREESYEALSGRDIAKLPHSALHFLAGQYRVPHDHADPYEHDEGRMK